MKHIFCIGLTIAVAVVCTAAAGQSSRKRGGDGAALFATNRYYGKAGLGAIDENLYIKLWSENNELLYGNREKWLGLSASTPEVAIAFGGKIWSFRNLPKPFDLSESVVISFEGSKVRFFDFRRMSGGYFERKAAGSAEPHK
jgi:hypothetical protein